MQKRRLVGLASLASGALLEAFAAVELLTPHFFPARQTGLVLLSHFAACAVFVPGFLLLFPPSYQQDKWISILLILGLSTALPVVGPLLVYIFGQYVLTSNRIGNRERSYYFGDKQYANGTESNLADNHTARSLMELLNSQDVETRRNAVLATKDLDSRPAISVLRMAQQDSDEQVRIFARNALSQITERLELSLKAIEKPELVPGQHLEGLVYVAERYHDYVELGLISEGTRKFYLDKVIDLLGRSLAAEPSNEKVLSLLVRFCLLAKDVAQAKTHLAAVKALASDPDVTIPWELEVYFEERDWLALGRLLNQLRRTHARDSQLMKVYDFWHQKSSRT